MSLGSEMCGLECRHDEAQVLGVTFRFLKWANQHPLALIHVRSILYLAARAELHAAKSGHVNFSESTEVIKPLNEEEKKAKLAELQARLLAKREGVQSVPSSEYSHP